MRSLKKGPFALLISLLLSLNALVHPGGTALAQVGKESTSSRDTGTCEVPGVLVNAISGDVITGAQIRLNLVGGAKQLTITDANGRFVLPVVPGGPQSVSAHKKGYIDAYFDIVACPPPQSSRDNLSQASSLNTLRLTPLSAISGRVTDEAGDPIVEAEVHAKLARPPAGQLRTMATTTTNDLGMYRLHGLPPGNYYVSAGAPEEASTGPESTDDTIEDYQTTYYPQAIALGAATSITVQPGNSPAGIDIQLAKARNQSSAIVRPISGTSTSTPDSSLSSADHGANSANAARATVIGSIVNETTNEPVKRAKITLEPTRNGGASYSSQTDSEGHFAIQVDAGIYEALVEKAGFLAVPHASTTASQIPVSLTVKPKQTLKDVVLRVTPWSVITGRVLDEDGNPAQDFQVQAFRYSYVDGKRQLQAVATSTTNDLGEYRLYGLSRGKYYVRTGFQAASTQEISRRMDRYVVTYYPQALNLESAAPIAVGEGVQVGGINVWAQLSKLVDVRGRLLSGSGSLNRDAVVALTRSADIADISFNVTRGIDAQGRFDFSAVPPGSYTLSALCNDNDGQYVAEQTIQVTDTTLDNVDLQLNRAATIAGRIRVDGGAAVAFHSVRVLLEPDNRLPTGSITADVQPDGTFSLSGLLPEQYTIELFGLPDGYYLKAARSGSDEGRGSRIDFRHATGPLTLIIAAGGSVVGRVRDHDQQPAPGVNVVLIPMSRDTDGLEPYRSVATDGEGKFRLVGLAPGTYEAFAIEGVDPSTYVDPDFLVSVQDYAQSITLQDSSTENVDMELISGGSQ